MPSWIWTSPVQLTWYTSSISMFFFFCSLPLLLIFNYLSGNLSTLLAFFSSSLHVLSFPFFHLSFYFPAFCLLPYIPHIPRKHRSNQASTELGQTRPYPQEHPRQTLVQHIYLPGFAFADLGIKAIAALFNYQVSLTPILPFLFFLLLSLALPWNCFAKDHWLDHSSPWENRIRTSWACLPALDTLHTYLFTPPSVIHFCFTDILCDMLQLLTLIHLLYLTHFGIFSFSPCFVFLFSSMYYHQRGNLHISWRQGWDLRWPRPWPCHGAKKGRLFVFVFLSFHRYYNYYLLVL